VNPREQLIPDFRVPSAARMYDYLLGGKDHFPADREMAERVLSVYPEARTLAVANRRFVARAVWYLAEHGITQYVDLGCGIPTSPMVHEIARNVRPDARVVYVDSDPVVAAHFRSVCNNDSGLAFVECDIRETQDILNDGQFRRIINFSVPVAFLCAAVLHFVPDEDHPKGVVAALRWRMVPGSYLVISHAMTDDYSKDAISAIEDVSKETTAQGPIPRTAEKISEFFTDLDLVEPGIVSMSQWRPGEPEEKTKIRFLAGVGRKPRDLPGWQTVIKEGKEMEDIVEQAVRAGREHREDMARWLALEVLMSDEIAGQDEVLQDRLSVLQEKIEEGLRVKTGGAHVAEE